MQFQRLPEAPSRTAPYAQAERVEDDVRLVISFNNPCEFDVTGSYSIERDTVRVLLRFPHPDRTTASPPGDTSIVARAMACPGIARHEAFAGTLRTVGSDDLVILIDAWRDAYDARVSADTLFVSRAN